MNVNVKVKITGLTMLMPTSYGPLLIPLSPINPHRADPLSASQLDANILNVILTNNLSLYSGYECGDIGALPKIYLRPSIALWDTSM